MSEQEELNLFEKISAGLKQSYEELLRRKAALEQDVIIGNADGQPVSVPAADLLAKNIQEGKISEKRAVTN